MLEEMQLEMNYKILLDNIYKKFIQLIIYNSRMKPLQDFYLR